MDDNDRIVAMAAQKHPIAHCWIRQTLVPFLLFAFVSTLPYPADISDQIQRSIDFCLQKPDHPSDGDDLVFERIFMAIMHRHKNLAPDLETVVDNLEPLAKYLIRRAQLKGPYELLGRSDVGSAAWVEYERHRLSNLILDSEEITFELLPPTRSPTVPVKPPPAENVLDTRLAHAQQIHSAATNIPTQLDTDNGSHYQHQDRDYEQHHSHRQPQETYRSAMPAQNSNSSCDNSEKGYMHSSPAYGSPYQQTLLQQSSQHPAQSSVSTPHQAPQQAALLQQTTPTTTSFVPNCFFPSTVLEDTLTQPHPIAQHAPAQSHEAAYPSTQYQPLQHQAAHHRGMQQQPTRSSSPARQYSDLVTPLPQLSSLSKDLLHQQLTPTSTHTPTAIPGSDLAHLRGTDWSAAATQRARVIAAAITAQERNTLTQGIVNHQQAITQNLPGAGFARSMHSPTKPSYAVPSRSNSTMGHRPAQLRDNTSAVSPAIHSQSGSAVNGWGITLPDHRARAALPTMEQIRARYFPALQQARTAALAMPAAGTRDFEDAWAIAEGNENAGRIRI